MAVLADAPQHRPLSLEGHTGFGEREPPEAHAVARPQLAELP
jgi:hypothetical protein